MIQKNGWAVMAGLEMPRLSYPGQPYDRQSTKHGSRTVKQVLKLI